MAKRMREVFFQTSPERGGLKPTPEIPTVMGVSVDWPMGSAMATIVAYADGTASLYTSTDIAIMGGYAAAAQAKALVFQAERSLQHSRAVTEHPYPPEGRARFYIRTYSDLRVIEEELSLALTGKSRHHELFDAANRIMTALFEAADKAEAAKQRPTVERESVVPSRENAPQDRRRLKADDGTTTEEHARFFHRQWPELDLSGPWIQYHKDSETTDYYNKSTMQRSGEFVGVWCRGDLSEAGLREARRLAAKQEPEATVVVMEKTFIYHLLDCQRKLIKAREIRIYSEGRLVAESKYEDENPMNWQKVDPTDQDLVRIVCGSKQ